MASQEEGSVIFNDPVAEHARGIFKSPLTLSQIFTSTHSAATFSPAPSRVSRNKFSLGRAQYFNSLQRRNNRAITISIDDEDEIQMAPPKKSRVPKIIWAMLFMFIGGIVALIILAFIPLDEEEEKRDDGFCGSIQRDEELRQIIAENLEDSLQSDEEPILQNLLIECLPNDAFSALSPQLRNIMITKQTLTFSGNGLREINPGAFSDRSLVNIENLIITQNGVSSLPEGVFKPLVNLKSVNLGANAFSVIEGKVFSQNAKLETVFLNSNSGLVELPQDLISSSQMKLISCNDCVSLIEVSAGFFESFENLQVLSFSRSLLSSILTLDEFILISGVNSNVTVLGFDI